MLYNIRTLYLMVIRIVYGRMCHEALPDSTDRRPSQGWRLFRGFCRGLGDRLAVLWGRQGYLLHLTTRRYVCTACSACAIARKSWSFFFFFFFFFAWCNPLALCVCFPGDWPLWESPQRRFSGQERRQRGDGTGRGSCMRWCHEVAGTNYLCSGHNNKRSPVEENQELINCRSRMTRLSNLIKATICCMLVFYYPSMCFFGGPILLAIIMCYSISCSGCDDNTKLHVCLELLSEL